MENKLELSHSNRLFTSVFVGFSLLLFVPPAFSQGPFYQGKVVTVIQGRDPEVIELFKQLAGPGALPPR